MSHTRLAGRAACVERGAPVAGLPASSERLSRAVEAFIGYVGLLPPSSLGPARGAAWGPREVLIHLVYWHEQYAAILHALLSGKAPALVHGTFKHQNAVAVEVNADEPVQRLLHRFETAQAELERLCADPAARAMRIAFKDGGKRWPLEEALTRIAAHITSHRRQLVSAGFAGVSRPNCA